MFACDMHVVAGVLCALLAFIAVLVVYCWRGWRCLVHAYTLCKLGGQLLALFMHCMPITSGA